MKKMENCTKLMYSCDKIVMRTESHSQDKLKSLCSDALYGVITKKWMK